MLSQPLKDLQYSFNSLYTPSYSIAGLVPSTSCDNELDTELGLTSTTPVPEPSKPENEFLYLSKGKEDESLAFVPSEESKAAHLVPQYQKLKMNYFRRLNVASVASVEPKRSGLNLGSVQKTIDKEKSQEWTSPSSKKFVPSFAPSTSRSSDPIRIPPRAARTHLRSLEDVMDRDEKGKTPKVGFSLKTEDTSDAFGVFDRDFEL